MITGKRVRAIILDDLEPRACAPVLRPLGRGLPEKEVQGGGSPTGGIFPLIDNSYGATIARDFFARPRRTEVMLRGPRALSGSH